MLIRTMHDIDPQTPIYRDRAGDGGELARALRHASCGIRPEGQLAFVPAEGAWRQFYEEEFCSTMLPAIVEIYSACVAGEIDRAIAVDHKLATELDAGVSERLRAAAPEVFAARAGAKSLRVLDRFAAAGPGVTFTGAFAAHSAAFNLPLIHALFAYLAIEWRASGRALESGANWEQDFSQRMNEMGESVPQALSRCLQSRLDVA